MPYDATDALRPEPDSSHRLHVVERYREHFQRVLATLGLDLFKSAVHDTLGNRLLAGEHQHVHELGYIYVTELRIRQHFPLGDFATTRHVSSFNFSVGARFSPAATN
jgi:hypothetical protein